MNRRNLEKLYYYYKRLGSYHAVARKLKVSNTTVLYHFGRLPSKIKKDFIKIKEKENMYKRDMDLKWDYEQIALQCDYQDNPLILATILRNNYKQITGYYPEEIS